MNPATIIAAIQAGVSIFNSVSPALSGVLSPKQQAIANAGASIVSTAANLYQGVQSDLSATDQASVDAALQAEDAQLAIHFAKLQADIAAEGA